MKKIIIVLLIIGQSMFAQTYNDMDELYKGLAEWEFYGMTIWAIGDVCSDDSEKGGGGPSDMPDIQNWSNYTFLQCNKSLYTYWDYSFKAIKKQNTVIADENSSEQYIAEARFLRALHYYYLSNVFGMAPIFDSDFDPVYNQAAFNTKEEILDFIVADLLAASAILPFSHSVNEKYRACKGAALTLLAKVYLYKEEWALAASTAEQVINSGYYELEVDYATNFKLEGEHGVESIFEIEQFDGEDCDGWCNDHTHNIFMQPRDPNVGGWGFNCPTSDFKSAFEAGDMRLSASVFSAGDQVETNEGEFYTIDVSESPTSMFSRKYYLPSYLHNGDLFRPLNIKVFRYSDVLLMAAEAQVYIGNLAEANNYLNAVRMRAGLSPLNIVSVPDFLAAIRQERRVELGLEGHRFFDLQRYYNSGVLSMRDVIANSGVDGGQNFTEGINEVFPIPSHVLYLNQNALQNPGYGWFPCVEVNNPYSELVVSANVSTSSIDLSNAFCSNPELGIISDEAVLSAAINNRSLDINYLVSVSSEVSIEILDNCNSFPVKETINIKIVEPDPVDEADVVVSEDGGSTTSIVISASVFDGNGLNQDVTYTATLSDGNPLPDWLIFDPATLSFTVSQTQSALKSAQAVSILDLLITAKDTDGISASVEYEAEIKGIATKIGELGDSGQVYVFPNPNNGEFKLFTNGLKGQLTILDISGKTIRTFEAYNGQQINIPELKGGNIYLYRFSTISNVWNGKIIVN